MEETEVKNLNSFIYSSCLLICASTVSATDFRCCAKFDDAGRMMVRQVFFARSLQCSDFGWIELMKFSINTPQVSDKPEVLNTAAAFCPAFPTGDYHGKGSSGQNPAIKPKAR